MDNQAENAPRQKNNGTAKIIAAAVIIFVALLVGFFMFMSEDSDQSAETNNQTPQATTQENNNQPSNDQAVQESENGEQAENTISYTDSGFTPATLTVKVGDTVTVINSSSRQLQFSSDDHPTHTKNPEINQGTTAPGESTSFTVSKAGALGYHDHLNPSRTGTLIVEE